MASPTKYSAKRQPWRFWRFRWFRRLWRFRSWRLPPLNNPPFPWSWVLSVTSSSIFTCQRWSSAISRPKKKTQTRRNKQKNKKNRASQMSSLLTHCTCQTAQTPKHHNRSKKWFQKRFWGLPENSSTCTKSCILTYFRRTSFWPIFDLVFPFFGDSGPAGRCGASQVSSPTSYHSMPESRALGPICIHPNSSTWSEEQTAWESATIIRVCGRSQERGLGAKAACVTQRANVGHRNRKPMFVQ